jgi:hypothetical protein
MSHCNNLVNVLETTPPWERYMADLRDRLQVGSGREVPVPPAVATCSRSDRQIRLHLTTRALDVIAQLARTAWRQR